jgi:hypothetical protein
MLRRACRQWRKEPMSGQVNISFIERGFEIDEFILSKGWGIILTFANP